VVGRDATNAAGAKVVQFSFGDGYGPGYYKVCYCQKLTSCEKDIDFFQSAGGLTVAGITALASVFVCYVRTSCTLELKGTQLNPEDSVTLNAPHTGCGMSGADTSTFTGQGFFTAGGDKVYVGTLKGANDGGLERWSFNLGSSTMTGRFRICYCASRLDNSENCKARKYHTQDAGEVYIRGVEFQTQATCQQGSDCRIVLRSTTFSANDRVQLVPSTGTCGDASKPVPSWLPPTAPLTIDPDQNLPHLYASTFVLSVPLPGSSSSASARPLLEQILVSAKATALRTCGASVTIQALSQ
jgi:hypothetical protein